MNTETFTITVDTTARDEVRAAAAVEAELTVWLANTDPVEAATALGAPAGIAARLADAAAAADAVDAAWTEDETDEWFAAHEAADAEYDAACSAFMAWAHTPEGRTAFQNR